MVFTPWVFQRVYVKKKAFQGAKKNNKGALISGNLIALKETPKNPPHFFFGPPQKNCLKNPIWGMFFGKKRLIFFVPKFKNLELWGGKKKGLYPKGLK